MAKTMQEILNGGLPAILEQMERGMKLCDCGSPYGGLHKKNCAAMLDFSIPPEELAKIGTFSSKPIDANWATAPCDIKGNIRAVVRQFEAMNIEPDHVIGAKQC